MHGFSRDEETILQRVAPYIAPPRNPDMLRLIPPLLFALVAFGVFQIVSDIAFSTKRSDWKKVRRELRAARAQAAHR